MQNACNLTRFILYLFSVNGTNLSSISLYMPIDVVLLGGGLEKLLLEMVSCGRLRNESAVMAFVDCTLMRVQQDYSNVSEVFIDFYFISYSC